ncbi:pyridoxamine 5'-phosphate oxidase family protein [Methanolobus bombayensis]|uniref:pyridoxamine 5'-phosphate oxidase family protein n=1 Tax=Methanolobus bombayensis TaxID=38023 RepID=UPI001AE479C6|nr:pyridoxamine 5'-phosphate oxidase family protein [Methanolobus bombayensis]MBP1909214.1 nitroimidazol reductase NimA-like FMN-containing flavoprotein (pyridoxamine 5'-phosphate oxidase superfamily) [Methanolobus bombayensis]
MFREMRRKKQELSLEDSIAILKRATSGILAVSGDNDYPYAVPLSFVYDDSKIYIHCAKTGHKLDAIARNEKVSFCVIDYDNVVPEKYTTYFRSVIVFGKASILDNPEDKMKAIEKLAARYSPNHEEGRRKEIDDQFKQLCLVEIKIEYMTGKEAIELAKMK